MLHSIIYLNSIAFNTHRHLVSSMIRQHTTTLVLIPGQFMSISYGRIYPPHQCWIYTSKTTYACFQNIKHNHRNRYLRSPLYPYYNMELCGLLWLQRKILITDTYIQRLPRESRFSIITVFFFLERH